MGFGMQFRFEALRSETGANIAAAGAAYTVSIGTAIGHPGRAFKIDNFTDGDLKFSFDGINDHFVLHAMSSWIQDISMNKQPSDPFFVSKRTQVFAQSANVGSPPTTGTVYFTLMYGKGD